MNEDDRKAIEKIVALEDRISFRRESGSLEREIWVRASRLMFEPGERQPCHVCGRFRSITQAHHVVPLTIQYNRGFEYPDTEYEWLCPNHHAMVHLYIQADDRSLSVAAFRARGRTTAALNEDLSEDEFTRLLELMRRAARSPE